MSSSTWSRTGPTSRRRGSPPSAAISRRAIQLYERVWRFADALPLALRLGDRGLAVRLALDANLARRATEIADATTAPPDLLAVADAFAARGRPFEAARAAERGGRRGARGGASTGRPARRSTRRASGPRPASCGSRASSTSA